MVQQRAAMDAFDPQRQIGLIVDEWGTWHPVEQGTNPAFLYQQNTCATRWWPRPRWTSSTATPTRW